MQFRRCGNSGLLLPEISLGLWHNFGDVDDYHNSQEMVWTAFENGITHFDLANNYGPPPGSAETNFGRVLKDGFIKHRDEIIISSKAGYDMWPGPYGSAGGSKKYLIASLDQSLKRMGLEYVDIFYHHCPDSETPLEESMGALEQIHACGKALYIGISSYSPEDTTKAYEILKSKNIPLLIHQPKYNMLHRNIENGLTDTIKELNIGCIVFSALAQGILSNKYLNGIPEDSRAFKSHGFLQKESITKELLSKIQKLDEIAKVHNQTLAQLAINWCLRNKEVTSVILGASRTSQILDAVEAINKKSLPNSVWEELNSIL
ncbi:MAG: L-glyceraldehyde 3-phosphate reductase [Planctomycetota bacterium]|nr:MAG: L-glyceraldehyde 3-phosphate reductase [Planctomycetota bacterium]